MIRPRLLVGAFRTQLELLASAEIVVGHRRNVAGEAGARVIKPFVVALTLVVFAVPTSMTLNLKHAGEEGVEAKDELQSALTELRVQDGVTCG
jgi:hypothetical protein